MNDTKPDRYIVVGNPIAQSKSPEIHTAFAKQTAENIIYDKQLIELGGFEPDVRAFFESGGRGLNITAPFKEDAYRFADKLSARAKAAGAVNTLALQDDGAVLGDNTDGAGMVADIKRQGWEIQGKRVLVLGAGGAVRGVLLPLLGECPASLTLANRTVSKAEVLAEMFVDHGKITACSFDATAGHTYDLVINGTSAGLAGGLPPLPDGLFADGAAAYDMIYGNEQTIFLNWAQKQGVSQLADGLGMLVGQAAEAFYVWRSKMPDVEAVINLLRVC